MKEEQLILYSIELIEKKSGWGSSENWTNYNFSLLSDNIKKETGKRVSESTLKRLFGRKKTKSGYYNPHNYTKNIIAEYLDYGNWEDFRIQHQEKKAGEKPEKVHIKNQRRPVMAISTLIFLLVLLLLFFLRNMIFSVSPQKALISFECDNQIGKVPFTAVFHYELEDIDDSVLVDFGNSESYFLSPQRNMITQFYKSADYTQVKISSGGQILKSCNMHILSDGWQAGVSPNDTMNAFTPFEDQTIAHADGRLFIEPGELEELGYEFFEDFFVEYRYFDDFQASLDEITLETVVKNSKEEGGKRCYDIEIIMKGEKEDFIIRFLEPGCFRYVRFHVGEKNYFGRFQDLSEFTRDISDWRRIKINISNKKAEIFFEDQLLRSESYEKEMGVLKGITYRFYGNGSVNYMKLSSDNKVILEDDFK